jgi:curved DNA-binding protein CbpA
VGATQKDAGGFQDYYEILQLSQTADPDTIMRVYHILVKRYHPDNPDTGNTEKFHEIVEAYKVLSDPEKRMSYDVRYDQNRAHTLKIFDEASANDNFDSDRRILDGVLSLLFVSRRRDPGKGGLGEIQLERLLGCPNAHLQFHIWYLREKGWVERLDNGHLAITVAGVDKVIEQGNTMMRRDRMIAENATSAHEASLPNGKVRELVGQRL